MWASLVLGLLLLPLLTFARDGHDGPPHPIGLCRDATPGGTRYSPLTEITPANVTQLKVAWVYHMKRQDAPNTGFAIRREDQPLIIGPTMYVVTPYSRVVALDASTGHEQWMFQIPMATRHPSAEPRIGRR